MTERRTKTPSDSRGFIAEIVGEESLIGQRMVAGELLHMMDLAAADAAIRHAECPLVTLAFDRIELLDRIYHRDYVRFDVCVIKVGRSSIVVQVDWSVKSPTEMIVRPGHSGFITMVAIDEKGRPNKNIPALRYDSPHDMEKKRIADERDRFLVEESGWLEKIDALTDIDPSRLTDPYPRDRTFSPAETRLTIRKRFLPRNANTLGIVFGGDTAALMEELSVAAARQFTGNHRMVTIAMEDVLFLKPLFAADLVEMTAQVVFVARTTLVVEVLVTTMGIVGNGDGKTTNRGIFTVLSYNAADRTEPIRNGLDLTQADAQVKRCYLKEQAKYERRCQGKKSPAGSLCSPA
jgi:acyl-CoA hydrolase